MGRFSAFTAKAERRSNVLQAEIGICNNEGQREEAIRSPPDHFYQAVWDTGATHTSVTPKVARECGLTIISKADVTGVHGTKRSNVYLVDVFLPNRVVVHEVRVVEVLEVSGPAEVLVGMDIIGLGDFGVNNYEGKTSFTFRMPSIEMLDFTNPPNAVRRTSPKVGRNDPCPCGNGKKYKHCHGQ